MLSCNAFSISLVCTCIKRSNPARYLNESIESCACVIRSGLINVHVSVRCTHAVGFQPNHATSQSDNNSSRTPTTLLSASRGDDTGEWAWVVIVTNDFLVDFWSGRLGMQGPVAPIIVCILLVIANEFAVFLVGAVELGSLEVVKLSRLKEGTGEWWFLRNHLHQYHQNSTSCLCMIPDDGFLHIFLTLTPMSSTTLYPMVTKWVVFLFLDSPFLQGRQDSHWSK